MAWKITNDYLEEPGSQYYCGAGKVRSPEDLVGSTFTFILKDDDGQTYYVGRADERANELPEGDPNSLYYALHWAMANAGCTSLWVAGECVFG